MRRSSFSWHLMLLVIFLLAAAVAFSLNLNSYFLSDDFVQIGKVLQRNFAVTWGLAHGGFFRPLFIWSYVVDSWIWQARPFGYHLTNVALHGLNAFLVFQLALLFTEPLQLAMPRRSLFSLAAAALFMVHPSHSEAVIWISGRADLIATLFVLASLAAYYAYLRTRRKIALLGSLACFVLGLLAKESAVCTPLLITVMLLGQRQLTRPAIRGVALSAGLFFAVLLAFIFVRAMFIGAIVGGYGTSQHLNFAPGWIRDRLLEASVRSVLPPLPAAWLSFLFKPLQSPLF